jgi:hypothetical protein
MMEIDEFSPERIADRAKITDALHRWCRGVDRLDAAGMRNAFHPDATDDHGHYTGNIEGLIAWIMERHKTIPFSLHAVNNVIIEFSNLDTAIVESNVLTAQHYPEASEATVALFNTGTVGRPMDMLAFARYVDRFERRNGQWKIAQRTVVYDSQIITESPGVPALSGVEVGRRDRGDFIYRSRKLAGLAD